MFPLPSNVIDLSASKAISKPFVSKSPPSCGDVSPTTSVLTELPDAAVIRP